MLNSRRIRMCAVVVAVTVALSVIVSTIAFAASAAKKYQVTGTVQSIDDGMIILQKGDEKWEIDRDKDTKSDAAIKVGQKVTVYYHMTADKIEGK